MSRPSSRSPSMFPSRSWTICASASDERSGRRPSKARATADRTLAQMQELARRAATFDWRKQAGGAQRAAQLHHRDRRPEHPLHPRQVEGAGRDSAAADPRLAGLGGRVPGPHRAADGPGEARRRRARRPSTSSSPPCPASASRVPTRDAGWNNLRIGKAFIELMGRLGYAKFALQGGDAGAIIGPEIGRMAPDKVIGIHLNAATIGFMPMGPVSDADAATLHARREAAPGRDAGVHAGEVRLQPAAVQPATAGGLRDLRLAGRADGLDDAADGPARRSASAS